MKKKLLEEEKLQLQKMGIDSEIYFLGKICSKNNNHQFKNTNCTLRYRSSQTCKLCDDNSKLRKLPKSRKLKSITSTEAHILRTKYLKGMPVKEIAAEHDLKERLIYITCKDLTAKRLAYTRMKQKINSRKTKAQNNKQYLDYVILKALISLADTEKHLTKLNTITVADLENIDTAIVRSFLEYFHNVKQLTNNLNLPVPTIEDKEKSNG